VLEWLNYKSFAEYRLFWVVKKTIVHEVNLGLFGSGVNQDPPVHHVGLMDGM
jgi:acyl-ACP thioesterase